MQGGSMSPWYTHMPHVPSFHTITAGIMCSYHLFPTKLDGFMICDDGRFYNHLVIKNE